MNEKAKDFFRNNIGYFVVALIAVIYIATSVVTMGRTGKTIGEIVSDGAVVLFLGVLINRIFDLQGMMNGERQERVHNTLALHSEIVTRISPYIDKLDKWCEEQNVEALRVQRTIILACNGMKYSDYFDENGGTKDFVINESKLKNRFTRNDELHRIKYYKKALRLKLTPITASGLTSEGGKKQDPYFFGRTKSQYERQTVAKDIISKIAVACLFGYYGAELVQDFSWASLIWKLLQVGIFVVMGVIKMYQSYMFVIDEYRGRIVKKIDNLQKFENYIKSLPAVN